MPKKKIKVAFVVTAELEVEQGVLDQAQTDEWRSTFYSFSSDQEVAEHIAFNLLKDARLEMLDGFADRKDSEAVLRSVSWETE